MEDLILCFENSSLALLKKFVNVEKVASTDRENIFQELKNSEKEIKPGLRFILK
jgi:hypothetical protein